MPEFKNKSDETYSQRGLTSTKLALIGVIAVGCIVYAIYAAIFCHRDASSSAAQATQPAQQDEFQGCLPKKVGPDGAYVFVCHIGDERFELPADDDDYKVTIEIFQP